MNESCRPVDLKHNDLLAANGSSSKLLKTGFNFTQYCLGKKNYPAKHIMGKKIYPIPHPPVD